MPFDITPFGAYSNNASDPIFSKYVTAPPAKIGLELVGFASQLLAIGLIAILGYLGVSNEWQWFMQIIQGPFWITSLAVVALSVVATYPGYALFRHKSDTHVFAKLAQALWTDLTATVLFFILFYALVRYLLGAII